MKGTNRKNTENTNRKNIKKARVAQLKKRLLISGLIITVMLFAILTLDNFVNVSATNELKKDNRLATDKITSGKYLVVSYYSNEYK